MIRSRPIGVIVLVPVLLWPAFSTAETSSNAKVCGYLPVPELEANFGSKATAFRGDDGGRPGQQEATCAVDLPDRLHAAIITSRKPDPPGRSVKEHLAAAQPVAVETKDFGAIGCYIARGLPATSCLMDGGHYLGLSVISNDPKQRSFESVKQLLEKAAARRK